MFVCFFVCVFEQSFCRRTKGARWLICAERIRQVWRKSAVKVCPACLGLDSRGDFVKLYEMDCHGNVYYMAGAGFQGAIIYTEIAL